MYMDNKYILIMGFVVGTIVGFMTGRYYSFGGDTLTGTAGTDGRSVAELEAKIEKAKKFFPSIPDMRSVFGTVEMVKENVLVIKSSPSINPFEDLPEKREVVVTSTTKIIRMTQKDPKVFQREIEAIQKEQSGRKAGEIPSPALFPNPFIEKEVSLKDLRAGDQVSVEAGENIKEKTRFEAVRVVVQEAFGGIPSPLPLPAK